MHIPIDFGFPRERRICPGEKARGDQGGEDDVCEFVEAEGGEDFVDVEGEGAEGEEGGEGLEGFDEEGGGGERVFHC